MERVPPDLYKISKEEEEKLGIEDKVRLKVKEDKEFSANPSFSEIKEMARWETEDALKLGDAKYAFRIPERKLKKDSYDSKKFRIECKHELYHIAAGHCDQEKSTLKYWFIQEPLASMYSHGMLPKPGAVSNKLGSRLEGLVSATESSSLSSKLVSSTLYSNCLSIYQRIRNFLSPRF